MILFLMQEDLKKEYEKDRKDIENIIDNIRKEDMLAREEMNRKRNIARSYMENSYARKDYQKKKEKEDEMLEKEKERKYLEEMKKREDELNSQKAKKQFEKDQIFNKLCEQEAQRKAEKDYWENIRNELHSEEENQRIKMAELAEKEKRQRQKEIMIESALQHKKAKEENKKKELEMEIEFKKNYLEKIKEEQELDKLNAQKRKEKELKLKLEAEKQWEMKLKQYQLQKEQELKERENLKAKELAKRYIIEQEKKRLLKENEDLLKGYYPLGYQKGLNSLRDVKSPLPQDDTKREIIKNNIFGNTNPNKSSAYPKYGNIKNFVYDKSVQDVHHKINIQNYPMYNATANNDYDSYPTPEEYLKMMKQTGQLNYAYAGGKDTTGIPMRGYLPIYQSKTLTNFISSPESSQNTNYSTLGNRRYLNKSLTNNYPEKNVISQARLNNYNYNQNAQEKVPEPA